MKQRIDWEIEVGGGGAAGWTGMLANNKEKTRLPTQSTLPLNQWQLRTKKGLNAKATRPLPLSQVQHGCSTGAAHTIASAPVSGRTRHHSPPAQWHWCCPDPQAPPHHSHFEPPPHPPRTLRMRSR